MEKIQKLDELARKASRVRFRYAPLCPCGKTASVFVTIGDGPEKPRCYDHVYMSDFYIEVQEVGGVPIEEAKRGGL